VDSVTAGVRPEVRAQVRPASKREQTTYAELARQVKELGLMERRLGYYGARTVALAASLVFLVAVAVQLGDSWWQLAVAAAFGFLATQVGFLGHDAAHRQIFRSGRANDWMALILANAVSGLSSAWWVHKHSRHHSAPNQETRDPDIGAGALAFTPAVATSRQSRLTAWLTTKQGWFFFPLLLLEGLNLHMESLRVLLGRQPVKRRWLELGLLLTRHTSVLIALSVLLPPGKMIAFLAVQLGVFGFYLGCAFAPNHTGMPIVPADARPDFLRRQVLSSRNVRGGRAAAFLMGGLNYQIEHHLFPSMPRPNLRRAREVVRPYCAAHGVPYAEVGPLAAYAIVIRHLNRVGLRARETFQCPLVAAYRPRG
jgi:fatty acid desaturase